MVKVVKRKLRQENGVVVPEFLIILAVATTQTPSSEAEALKCPILAPRHQRPVEPPREAAITISAAHFTLPPTVKCDVPFLERQAFVRGRHGNASLL